MFRTKQKAIIRSHPKESKKLILQLQFISLRSQTSKPYESNVSVKKQRTEYEINITKCYITWHNIPQHNVIKCTIIKQD